MCWKDRGPGKYALMGGEGMSELELLRCAVMEVSFPDCGQPCACSGKYWAEAQSFRLGIQEGPGRGDRFYPHFAVAWTWGRSESQWPRA
jgi:hypothetical protein